MRVEHQILYADATFPCLNDTSSVRFLKSSKIVMWDNVRHAEPKMETGGTRRTNGRTTILTTLVRLEKRSPAEKMNLWLILDRKCSNNPVHKPTMVPKSAIDFLVRNATKSIPVTAVGLPEFKQINNQSPIQNPAQSQTERVFSVASTFISGVLAISASYILGVPLKSVDPKTYDMSRYRTEEAFAVLVNTITQFWAPTVIRVSGDESMKDQLYQMEDGTLRCNFPHRLILMANHQLYTDWLYLWWVAYTNKTHGHIYIILKESLKHLPIFGWIAQFYNFIFVKRQWETDRSRFQQALAQLQNPKKAMWLLIFPEGTNLAAVTREQSAAWATKTGIEDMRHQLLPRSTGLRFCLQELHRSTNWLYDCTIAYEGVPKGRFGQDIYTLRSTFLEGRPPKRVNLFWRRWKVSEIPYANDEAFSRWLTNRWREKDYLLEYFAMFGSFPDGDVVEALAAVGGKDPPRHRKMITTEVKGGGWDEFLTIFEPFSLLADAMAKIDMTKSVPGVDDPHTKAAPQKALLNGNVKTGTIREVLTVAIPRADSVSNRSTGRRMRSEGTASSNQPPTTPKLNADSVKPARTTMVARTIFKQTSGRGTIAAPKARVSANVAVTQVALSRPNQHDPGRKLAATIKPSTATKEMASTKSIGVQK